MTVFEPQTSAAGNTVAIWRGLLDLWRDRARRWSYGGLPKLAADALLEVARYEEAIRTGILPPDLPYEPLPSPPRVRRVTNRTRFLVIQRDNYRCQLCGRKAVDGAELEVDHKHPWSKGGTDEMSNLWTLCDTCNSGKSNLPL